MTNNNKQYDLMKAFQIKSSDVFDIPKEFKKISLNVPQHGGSIPSQGDEIDLKAGYIGTVDSITDSNVVISFPNKPTKRFKLDLTTLEPGTFMTQGPVFILDELEDIQNINYNIMVLNDKVIYIYEINKNNFQEGINYRIPVSDKIFKFPSLYMWIPQGLWEDRMPTDKTLFYAHNYKKHQNILAVQKELAKNNIKIPYKPLYEYLQYINNDVYSLDYSSKDLIQPVINCIINLTEIRRGLMKTPVEKKRLPGHNLQFIERINSKIESIKNEEDRRLSVSSLDVQFRHVSITEINDNSSDSADDKIDDKISAKNALIEHYQKAFNKLGTNATDSGSSEASAPRTKAPMAMDDHDKEFSLGPPPPFAEEGERVVEGHFGAVGREAERPPGLVHAHEAAAADPAADDPHAVAFGAALADGPGAALRAGQEGARLGFITDNQRSQRRAALAEGERRWTAINNSHHLGSP